MKAKRFLALFMSAATMVTLFAACGKGGEEAADETTTTTAAQTQQQDAKPAEKDVTKGLKATKTGSFKKNAGNYDNTYANASYYKTEDGKYGIISADGKHDTGAIYTFCESKDAYFIVSKTAEDDMTTIAQLNAYGLVDGMGNVVVPLEYASYTRINARYYRWSKVTEETDNEDEALVSYEDEIFFKGVWVIYDLTTGKTVSGATGTQAWEQSANGFALEYVTDAEETKKVGPAGNAIPEDARILDNDCYYVQNDAKVAVYDAYGAKLFEYTGKNYVSVYSAGEGRFNISDSSEKYFIVDKTGKVLSKVFDESISDCTEDFIISNGRVYDYSGKIIVDGDYNTIKKDTVTNSVWYISGNDGKGIIKKDGTFIFQCKNNDGVSLNSTNFIPTRESDGNYYSFAAKDYIYDGYTVAPWLVQISSDDSGKKAIVDVLSGSKLVDGYESYDVFEKDGTIYIHATSYELDSVDVFKVG